MELFNNVRTYGQSQPLSVEVGPTHVYERRNFRSQEEPAVNSIVWTYDEVQYTLSEYVARQQEKIEEIQSFISNYSINIESRLARLESSCE